MPFPFESLTIYKSALNFVQRANNLETSPKFRLKKPIADQLGRAALSIPLNIAEGSGRWHQAEQKQFYRIARGSIFECVSIIQVMQSTNEISDPDYKTCYEHLENLSKMISGIIKSAERTH